MREWCVCGVSMAWLCAALTLAIAMEAVLRFCGVEKDDTSFAAAGGNGSVPL